MLLIWLLGLITVAISGSAAFFSVYGLAQLFTGAFLPVIIMGGALEAAKLVSVSFLYTHWKKINFALKSYLMFAVFGLMCITSIGIFGFLSSAYQTDSVDLKVANQQIDQFNEEKSGYEHRLDDINDQIKNVPSTNVRQKIQLIKSLNTEKQDILTKLDTVTNNRDKLSASKVKTEVKTGPITFVAKAIGKSIDDTTVYLTLMIMLVFDPLAVALTVAINMAIKYRKEEVKPVTTSTESVIQPIIEPAVTSIPESNSNLAHLTSRLDELTEKDKKKNEIINSIRSQD